MVKLAREEMGRKQLLVDCPHFLIVQLKINLLKVAFINP